MDFFIFCRTHVKFNKLKETGANIAQNLFERDELKDTITILTNLAEVVENLTDIMGFLPVVIGTVYTAMKGFSGGLIRLINHISSSPFLATVKFSSDVYEFNA